MTGPYDPGVSRATTSTHRSDGDPPSHSLRWGFALLVIAVVAGLSSGLGVPSRVRYVVFAGLALAAVALMVRTPRGKPGPARETPLDDSDLVGVALVSNETEAAIVRGMLQANGVACRYRQTNFGAGSMDGMRGGQQQILVREADVSKARELLAKVH